MPKRLPSASANYQLLQHDPVLLQLRAAVRANLAAQDPNEGPFAHLLARLRVDKMMKSIPPRRRARTFHADM